MEIIIGRSGNQKMPITDPTVSKKHCKVTDNGDGSFTVENLSQTFTKVDGMEIIRKRVTLDSELQLGPAFKAPLRQLLGIGSSSGPVSATGGSQGAQAMKKEKMFNIIHLKKIWDDYELTNIEIAKKQHKITLIRTGLGLCTMCTMPLYLVIGPAAYALFAVGLLGNVYSFVGMKNVDSPEEKKRRQDEFENAWVCPNPECNRSLMAKNYKMLKRNYQSCPYCKCKYVEKK